MKNAINWFEIPATNFERAKAFYEELFEGELQVQEMPEFDSKMGFFPVDFENGAIGGSIITGPGYQPSEIGALIYLNGGDDLNIPLSKVEKAGGKIIVPKTAIGEHGYMAHFTDTEGNKLALHSQN